LEAVTIGPLAFPFGLLALFGALLAGLGVAKWAARARRVDAEPLLWLVVLAGLVAARLTFVFLYQDQYLAAPWSMLDIRDGGFFGPAGLLAIAIATALLAWRNKEKRASLLYAVGAGVTVWMAAAVVPLAMPAPRMQVPQITLVDTSGRNIRLEDFAGKPLVINLWASWCPPCRREMPVLGAAQLRHPEVNFVFANQGESQETVRNYLAGEAFRLDNVLLDSGRQLTSILGSGALPTTLFFNAQGVLVDQRMGELSAATLAQRLESLQQSR
jgi:thiol-disulfide isomerase/thioredoxin